MGAVMTPSSAGTLQLAVGKPFAQTGARTNLQAVGLPGGREKRITQTESQRKGGLHFPYILNVGLVGVLSVAAGDGVSLFEETQVSRVIEDGGGVGNDSQYIGERKIIVCGESRIHVGIAANSRGWVTGSRGVGVLCRVQG